MRFLKPILAAAAIATAASVAPIAMAQSGTAASVIVIDYERIVATSDIGRDMAAKLQAIGTQMQGEIQPEQTSLEQEQQRIQAATQGMTQEQVQSNSTLTGQINTFAQRFEAFRARQIVLARDMEYTRQMTLSEFNRQISPIVLEVMTARGAGVVLDAGAAQIVQPQFNATDDVVARLNQTLRTMNVSRQTAPPQQPGQQ